MFLMSPRDRFEFLRIFTEGAGCLFPLVLVLAYIALLAAIVRALSRVDSENRLMEPSQVWLNLIPVINFIWLPVTIDRVGESFRNEMLARGRNKKNEGYARSAGFIAVFLTWAGALIPYIGVVFFIFSLIYAGVYWILVNGYGKRLKESQGEIGGTAPVDEGW